MVPRKRRLFAWPVCWMEELLQKNILQAAVEAAGSVSVVRAPFLAATRVRRCGAWQRHPTKAGAMGKSLKGAQ